MKDAVETYHKTVILVTHDIDEAVALSKRVVVLSGRPARVKVVHDIDIAATSPIAARSDSRFSGYFHSLCAELDIQTERTALHSSSLEPTRGRSADRARRGTSPSTPLSAAPCCRRWR